MQPGEIFDGRYLIIRILGQGGMGMVYLAQNIHTGSFWAIKEIFGNGLPAEPNFLKRLEHPALPRLFDMLEQDGRLYMVFDYIDGTALDKKLEEEGLIAEETVTDWAIQLCGVLEYLHSLKPNPIIYRDMKPSNIILTENGLLKLVDFGIAREYKPCSDGDTVYIGTRGYAAPEQYGTGQTSAASDIYSLGVTMHQLLTGRNPADSMHGIKPVRQYVGTLSPGIEAIVQKCTRENPDDRYRSAALLQRDLEALRSTYGKARNDQSNEYTHAEKYSLPAGNSLAPDGGYFIPDQLTSCGRVISDSGHIAPGDGCLIPDSGRPVSGGSHHIPAGKDKAVYRLKVKRQAGFRKLVVAIWDNAEFGCELAYMAAKHTKSRVLLADMDLLAPKADLILKLEKFPAKASQGAAGMRSGLDLVMDALGKGPLDEDLIQQAAVKRKDMKNLHVLTGNYHLENYEYFNEESVPRFIEKCYRSYDITILLVNRSIYDAFTMAALLKSDMNIAAIHGDVGQMREFNSYVEFLKEKQRLPIHRTQFVLFEYDNIADMKPDEAGEAVRKNLLGTISYSRRRLLHRNLNGAYAARMEKNIEQEYVRLLARMGLLPEFSILYGGFRAAFGRLFGNASGIGRNIPEE